MLGPDCMKKALLTQGVFCFFLFCRGRIYEEARRSVRILKFFLKQVVIGIRHRPKA